MTLRRLTDELLRYKRITIALPKSSGQFANPSELVAKHRAGASMVRIGRAALDCERACDRYVMAAPGTSAQGQATLDARDAHDAMTEGAETAMILGDPYEAGRLGLDALEFRTRAARFGCPMTLYEFRSAVNCPPYRDCWNQAIRAIVEGLFAVGRIAPADVKTSDVCEILAGILKWWQ